MMDIDNQRLHKFEPENPDHNYCLRYLKKIVRLLLYLSLFLYIILSQSSHLGEQKSQSLSINRVQNLTYEMSSKLLPIHALSKIKKHEVTNRMECLINEKYEPCIQYCKDIAKT